MINANDIERRNLKDVFLSFLFFLFSRLSLRGMKIFINLRFLLIG